MKAAFRAEILITYLGRTSVGRPFVGKTRAAVTLRNGADSVNDLENKIWRAICSVQGAEDQVAERAAVHRAMAARSQAAAEELEGLIASRSSMVEGDRQTDGQYAHGRKIFERAQAKRRAAVRP